MSLNDPFNRVQKQQQGAYKSFIASLKKSGIEDDQSAKNLLDNTLKRARLLTLVIAVITAATLMLWPKQGIILLVFALLVILWLFTTTIRARMFIQRYRQEELHKPSSD